MTPMRLVAAGILLLLTCAACAPVRTPQGQIGPVGSDRTAGRSGACEPVVGTGPPPGPDTVKGHIRVLAAASLTDAFGELAEKFERTQPDAKVDLSFGASSNLVAQVHAGAPADVLATADTTTMDLAVDPPGRSRPDVDTPVTLTCNAMTIITAPGNRLHITSLEDLARHDVRFVLCAAPVPCGRLGREVLRHAGIDARPVGSEADVTAVVAKVASGEVDAGIVYITDARDARGTTDEVPIPASQNITTTYPIAVTRDSGDPRAARAFIAFATSPAGQRILHEHGFGTH